MIMLNEISHLAKVHLGTWTTLLLVVASLGASPDALASNRRFAFTYESLVLAPGEAELEPWITVRNGREDYYNRIDTRLELELGVTERLQTALYFNARTVGQDVGTERVASSEVSGVSNEWKLKLTDPVADAVGVALYGELTAGATELETEAKLIVDKQVGAWVVAANLVGELEWELGQDETERETVAEVLVAAGYLITPALLVGLEARSHTAWVAEEGLETSVVHAGPVLSYATQGWWAALTFAPQLARVAGEGDDLLDLEHSERMLARVVVGVEL